MLLTLMIGLVALLLISAATSPLESLSWYAGWYDRGDVPDAVQIAAQEDKNSGTEAERAATHYIVYLSGIGAVSGLDIPAEEEPFLNGLEQRLPDVVLIRDVFPYSVTNSGLNGQRSFARLWTALENRRIKNPAAVSQFLINIRNMFQVAVSADRRYGPIYNYGVAQEILRGLKRHGYIVEQHKPVTLIGWSGGGQISVGAATFLQRLIAAPITVISVGGVISDDPGLAAIEHLYHFYGEKDPVQAFGEKLYPGRWPTAAGSYWNEAQAAGKITMISLGPYAHNGKGNYFDMKHQLPPPDERRYGEKTLAEVIEVFAQRGLTVLAA